MIDPVIDSVPGDPHNAPDSAAPERVSIRARRTLPLNWPVFGILVALAAVGIAAFLAQRSALPPAVQTWWPLIVIGVALVWIIQALSQQRPAGLLGSSALLGIGISLLLATAYQVAFGVVWLGLTLIAVGMGIVLRGLLWRSTAV